MRPHCMMLLSTVSLGTACVTPATTLPTQEAVNQIEHESPPVYQLLYDAPVLPETQTSLQRVRILIWLVQLDLSATQLSALEELRAATEERRQALVAAELSAAQQHEPQEQAAYDAIFDTLQRGGSIDDPALEAPIAALTALRTDHNDSERLRRRVEAMRATIESMGQFIRTLSQTQENMIVDALFFLRNRLDPIGNPGDFNALVGTSYDPGQYAVISRGTGEEALKPTNIGGLWSDEPGLTGRVLHGAQREVILYLALLEPGMQEAIHAAINLRNGTGENNENTPPSNN